jgi:O-antigen ligase
VLLAFTTFAFGGVYLPSLTIACALSGVLFLAYRPWPRLTFAGRWSAEAWLAVMLALAAVQLVPLPAALIDLVSPHARAVWTRLVFGVPSSLPISTDLHAGLWALLVIASTAATYACARHVFARGGVRRVARAIASIGFVLSLLALAQEATAAGRMYWRWLPLQEGAPPFGPFVNRNDFGTWAVLAIPTVLGYLAAHVTAHRHEFPGHVSWRTRLRMMADGRAIWLFVATMAMVVALAVSLSRSAMFGLAVAFVTAAFFRPPAGMLGQVRPIWMAGAVALAVVAVLMNVSPQALAGRISQAPISAASRWVIWKETIPMIRDFWLTGTGAGTYETVMLVYQRTSPGVRFNTAHNHYLQFAAEGGLLLAVPFVLALRGLWRDAQEMVTSDESGIFFLRAGAICGLAGAAAQSVWDTGLTTPANAYLAAILVAVAVHAPIRNRPAD